MELTKLLIYLEKQGFEKRNIGYAYHERIHKGYGLAFYVGYSHGTYFGCGKIKEGEETKNDTPMDRLLSYDISRFSGQVAINKHAIGVLEIYKLMKKEIRNSKINSI